MQGEVAQAISYCGPAPLPHDLPGAFNLDPWLLAALAGAAALGMRRGRVWARGRRYAFAAGLAVLILTFVSPLCALSSALFSARILHHVLLVSVAALLLALALPAKGGKAASSLPLLVLTQLIAMFFWHAPGPYGAALADDRLYWLMEATLLGSATLLWRELLAPGTSPLGAGLAHLVVIASMGLLGALITFAPVPLYTAHFLTTAPFGLGALEDQQLAGLLMWVPAMLPNLVAALFRARRLVEDAAPEASRAA